MTTEWMHSSIHELIKAYKKEENLFDSKHKLYHNKQARNASWNKILAAVKKARPETTLIEVNKKIQTLRTQYGQEVGKIEKSKNSEFVYAPKVWWYSQFNWIGEYMKTRNDSTPLAARTATSKNDKISHSPIVFQFDDVEETSTNAGNLVNSEIEFAEFESPEPPTKKLKTYQTKSIRVEKEVEDDDQVRTIEYTLINEDDNDESTKISKHFDTDEDEKERNLDRFKRRSKAFGKYVAALMMDITNDEVFFDLQRNITKSIQDASIRENSIRKK